MQIKVRRARDDAATSQRSPEPAPKRPDGEPDPAERTYEDAQDAEFDPRGDRAPDAADENAGRKTSR